MRIRRMRMNGKCAQCGLLESSLQLSCSFAPSPHPELPNTHPLAVSQRRRRNFRWHQICFSLGNKLKFSTACFDLRSVTLAFRLTSLAERKLVCAQPAQPAQPPYPPTLPYSLPVRVLTSAASPSAQEKCPGSSSRSRWVCSDESREILEISVKKIKQTQVVE